MPEPAKKLELLPARESVHSQAVSLVQVGIGWCWAAGAGAILAQLFEIWLVLLPAPKGMSVMTFFKSMFSSLARLLMLSFLMTLMHGGNHAILFISLGVSLLCSLVVGALTVMLKHNKDSRGGECRVCWSPMS